MALIRTSRHTAADMDLWHDLDSADLVHARYIAAKVASAIDVLRTEHAGYASVSWGKDSVVVAHMARDLGIPLVWIRVEPIKNPDCELVRDAFLSRYDCEYVEITRWCERRASGWAASGTLESGAKEAQRRFGRRITGVRAAESGERQLSAFVHGFGSVSTVRPILWWSVADVMAYLAVNDLPIHPAYAMLGGGRYDREWIRVASLGGQSGRGMDRGAWEQEYYGDMLNRLEAL